MIYWLWHVLEIKFSRIFTKKQKEEEIWLSPKTKAPIPEENKKKQSNYTKKTQKKYYTMIASVTLKIDLLKDDPPLLFSTLKSDPPVTFQLLKVDRRSLFNSLESLFNVEKWPFFAGVII